jgi:two-component system, chemotaxis family, chemotaxis protein CheV
VTQSAAKQDILLESGTNELEVLVFKLGPTHFGVNVAKVREVIGHVDPVEVPKAHPSVIGVFKLRDSVIPLVDLQLYFKPGQPSTVALRNVVLMEFNNVQIGFQVDSVERIYRISWKTVRPMPIAQSAQKAVITSVCELDGHLVLMIDFEKIAFEVNGDRNVYTISNDAARATSSERKAQHVLLAEDSPTIRGAIETNLVSAGYAHVTSVSNGEEAWNTLEASLEGEDARAFTLVVTDIEMPAMDGLHLCKRVKEHPKLKSLPVVVFSSLVSDSNVKKCEAVGADAALTKPQMGRLVELLDKLLSREARPTQPATGAAAPGPAEPALMTI